ncbi:MAG: chromate transporter [Clostridia bacterium]|nr:chromate transporter [Clostridia bacterium]
MLSLYLKLFYEFFKTGLFAVGGGMATIPFLSDMANKYPDWFTQTDLSNMIAVGESTPGPIGVNMATYVGFITGSDYGVLGSVLGAIVATLGLITPSIIIILIISAILKNFKDNKYVNNAFYGLRPASTGLIAAAGISVIASTLINVSGLAFNTFCLNWKGLILAVVIWLFSNLIKKTKALHPIVFIAFSALIGIIFKLK